MNEQKDKRTKNKRKVIKTKEGKDKRTKGQSDKRFKSLKYKRTKKELVRNRKTADKPNWTQMAM